VKIFRIRDSYIIRRQGVYIDNITKETSQLPACVIRNNDLLLVNCRQCIYIGNIYENEKNPELQCGLGLIPNIRVDEELDRIYKIVKILKLGLYTLRNNFLVIGGSGFIEIILFSDVFIIYDSKLVTDTDNGIRLYSKFTITDVERYIYLAVAFEKKCFIYHYNLNVRNINQRQFIIKYHDTDIQERQHEGDIDYLLPYFLRSTNINLYDGSDKLVNIQVDKIYHWYG